MDPADRLASYLADELDPEERAAVDAELARDAALRAQLAALQRADSALGGLRSPQPPAGFDARLDARLDAELDAVLGPATDAAAAPAGAHPPEVTDEPDTAGGSAATDAGDELAARRQARGLPRWAVAVSGAAAALVVIAGVGVLVGDLFGGVEDDMVTTMDAPSEAPPADMEVAEDGDDAVAAPTGPTIVATGRAVTEDGLGGLLGDPTAFGLADLGLDPASASGVRDAYLAVLPFERAVAQDDAPETERADPELGPLADAELRLVGDVDDATLAEVTRCLDVVLADSPTAIPTYAELLTVDGEEVIALGLITEDPATGAFTRRELWVVTRDGCDVRLFTQE